MTPFERATLFESTMKEVGFYLSGGGDFADMEGRHVWLVPVATGVEWLQPYTPGMWVADYAYTTEEMASGVAMEFDTPIAAAVYLRTLGD